MSRIDFYIAKKHDFLKLACLVTDKIYRLDLRCYIHTESEQQAKQIDDLLWTFQQNNFLPHELYSPTESQTAPILIGYAQQPELDFEVLVNLTKAVPVFFNQFKRVAEIVGEDESQKQIARSRYLYYKENGYELYSHDM
jgi:DNA polymerase III subunit chi